MKLTMTLMMFLFLRTALHALTLAWDPSPGTNIAGYKIWYGTRHSIYTGVWDVGNALTISLTNLVPGKTYFFAATAYTTAYFPTCNCAESDYSNEVAYTVPVAPPLRMIIRNYPNVSITLENATSVTGNWSFLTNVTFSGLQSTTQGFYRASMQLSP